MVISNNRLIKFGPIDQLCIDLGYIKGWTFHRSKPLNVELIQQYPEKPVY